MPPSDSRLKVTMSPCLRPTSSTQSFGRETMRVEYPTFWTFRASIMRDIVYIFYTNEKKKVGYILELLRMLFLYLAEEIYCVREAPDLRTTVSYIFHSLRGRFGMRLPGR